MDEDSSFGRDLEWDFEQNHGKTVFDVMPESMNAVVEIAFEIVFVEFATSLAVVGVLVELRIVAEVEFVDFALEFVVNEDEYLHELPAACDGILFYRFFGALGMISNGQGHLVIFAGIFFVFQHLFSLLIQLILKSLCFQWKLKSRRDCFDDLKWADFLNLVGHFASDVTHGLDAQFLVCFASAYSEGFACVDEKAVVNSMVEVEAAIVVEIVLAVVV